MVAIHYYRSAFCLFALIFIVFFSLPVYGSVSDDQSGNESSIQDQEKPKPKIIFKESLLKKESIKEDMITLLPNSEFEVYGKRQIIGDKGIFLKQAMKNDVQAIVMVEDAYSQRTKGGVLMGVGAITWVVGGSIVMLASMSGSGYYDSTEADLFFTIGSIPGIIITGIGGQKYFGLSKKLRNAVELYNQNLLNKKPKEEEGYMMPIDQMFTGSLSQASNPRFREYTSKKDSIIIFRYTSPVEHW